MADSLLDNYNPLYDIHLRQYFALPHMQKHLQKMGLLESTLNLNGDEVYARHHAMMDMMLKNREAQLMKMAELRKKLDAAEKVECCRRIRTGQSPESYRQGKPSRSLSRNRAGQKGGSGGRQRRYSNSFEDRDYVQRIEEQNADPVEQNTRDPYKRLSANAKRFNYLHKLDDKTLVSYKDNLQKQLQRLERFREISFGPHSVARQPPPPQASWFFRRRSLPSLTASAPGNTLKEPLRSVLNMRGRKATTGNKLNASHDSRTSCPPTTRKRKDSNTRLPPIHPQKNRVPTKPPAPVSLQQITTKLPPAAKKPAPTRGRPSNKRQTTTTTTTTITAVSKSPQISNTNTTTLPALPSVTGHGIFTGAAAAATAAAVGTAAINIDSLINDEKPEEPTPPRSPVLETQKTFDRSSPTQEVPTDILDNLADESEQVSEQVSEQAEEEYIPRQIVLDNAPVNVNHGDYEDSDSEPEYAEEDRESPEEEFVRQEVGVTAASPDQPLEVHVHQQQDHISPPVSDMTQESPKELDYNNQDVLPSPEVEKVPSPTASARSRTPPTLIFTEQSTEEAPQSPVVSEAQQSPVVDVHSTHVVEHFESHDATPQSPVLSVHGGVEHEEEEAAHSPVMSVHDEAPQSPVLSEPVPQSPIGSVHSSHHSEHHEPAPQSPIAASEHHSGPQSPVGSVHSSHHSEHQAFEHQAPQSPGAASEHHSGPQSPVLSMHTSMHQEAPQSPIGSVHSSHHSEHQAFEHQVPQSPIGSVHSSHHSEHHEPAPQSPVLSVHSSDHHFDQAPQAQSPMETSQISEQAPKSPTPSDKDAVELSPSIYSSQFSEQQDPAPQSPVGSERSARSARSATFESSVTMQESYMSEQQAPAPQSPVGSVHHSEHDERAPQSSVAVTEHSEHFSEHQAPQSPVGSVHSSHHSEHLAPQSPAAVSEHSEHISEHHEPDPQSPVGSVHSSHHSEHHEPAPQSTVAVSEHSEHISEHQAPQSPVGSVHSSHHSEHHVPEHQAPLSPVGSIHSSHHSEHQAPQSPVGSVHSSHHSEHHEPAPQSPAAVLEHHEPAQVLERAPSAEHSPRPKSPAESEKDGFERASSVPSDHENHQAAPQSPIASEKDMDLEKAASVHGSAPQSPSGGSPREQEHHEEHVHFQEGAPEQMEHEATPGSPVEAQAFVPRSPSVHTSDAEEETFEVQHHQVLTHSQPAAPRSPTEMDLYNPSSGPQDSPVMSDSEDNVTSAIPIADRIEMEAYHDSPTKESTSPVAVNPIEIQVNAEQVAQQLSTPEQKFEDIINQSADEEASHLIQEALTEAPAIIDMVNTYEEKERFPDAMMTSMYQPGSDHSDHELEPTTQVKEWDEGSQHIKESTVNSEFSDGNTHTTYQETVTIVTDNGNAQDHASPKSDNISTDSLVIHDDQGDRMTQSIYQPHSDDETTHEKDWDEGNKHFHETITEHTDESGKHFTETVTTTTTVIKSGDDDLKNNNDEEDAGSDDEKDKIIEEEEEEHGSNGNLVRETITTTTHTVTSGGLPEGGILVDDGDEKNISSL